MMTTVSTPQTTATLVHLRMVLAEHPPSPSSSSSSSSSARSSSTTTPSVMVPRQRPLSPSQQKKVVVVASQQQQQQQPSLQRKKSTKQPYRRKRSIPTTELQLQQVASRRQEAYESIMRQQPSVWSFESLFPAPILDMESIATDLSYYSTKNNTTSSTSGQTTKSKSGMVSSSSSSSLSSTMINVSTTETGPQDDVDSDPLLLLSPLVMLAQQLPTTTTTRSTTSSSSTNNSNNNNKNPNNNKPKSSFWSAGTNAMLQFYWKQNKQQQQQQQQQQQLKKNVVGSFVTNKNNMTRTATTTTTTADRNSNNNSTTTNPKIDVHLTRLVEDRVYGYRRFSNGEYQYETSLLTPDSAVQFRDGVRLSNPLSINADLLTYYAKCELQHGRIEEAMELYERAIAIDPADGRAYLGLSKCAERRHDVCLARKWLQQGITQSVSIDTTTMTAVAAPPTNDNSQKQPQQLPQQQPRPDRGANPFLLQAMGCLEEKSGRLSSAESYYQAAVASRPSHAAAWVALGLLRTRKLGYPIPACRKCFQYAVDELNAAGKPPSSHVYTSWANFERTKAGDKNKARELFQKAIQIDTKCSAAYLQLGTLEASCENWDAAEAHFETVLKFDQRNSRVLQAYALMETKRPMGDSRKAIGLFERALQANPRDAGVLQAYALYVADLGDVIAARDLLRRGTIVNKRHAAVWQAWGVLESRQGEMATARRIFQEGIWACGQLTGGQSGGYHCDKLWQAWGVLEASQEQYAAARRCFSRSLDANQRNVPAYTAWSRMEESIGQIDDARMILERALTKFGPGSPDKMNLYRTYELMEQRLGNVDAARNVYQRSVRETLIIRDEPDVATAGAAMSTATSTTTTVSKTTTKKNEFEVVRWTSQGGEVWMNERAIEAKVPTATGAAVQKTTSLSTTKRRQQPLNQQQRSRNKPQP